MGREVPNSSYTEGVHDPDRVMTIPTHRTPGVASRTGHQRCGHNGGQPPCGLGP